MDTTLLEQARSDKGELLQDFILDRLKFSSMGDREEEVTVAHNKTFEWLFQAQSVDDDSNNKHADILGWMRELDTSLYWVTGKAGCGKSTLMRFMRDHKESSNALQHWAGSKKLTIGAFFFWIAGSIEQRSQVGLLRHLLHQLLDTNRLLVPIVLPDMWSQLWNASTKDRIAMAIDWDLTQLSAGLKLFLHHTALDTKVALFIDGLDELDGDHIAMVTLLQEMVEKYGPNVKLCVSSRPWPVFEQAFDEVPHLRMQDLTVDDMRQYVKDKLLEDSRLQKLFEANPQGGEALQEDIVSRASGVFLWVNLAVQHLLDHHQPSWSATDFLIDVQTLPPDLDELFHHILFVVLDSISLDVASTIFQIVRAREAVCEFTKDQSSVSMTLWEMTLACFSNPAYVIDAVPQKANTNWVRLQCSGMASTLNNCCKGFLRIHEKKLTKEDVGLRFQGEELADEQNRLPNSKIVYIHRTARDFLFYSGVWDRIAQPSLLRTDFDPHLDHLKACILYLKLPLDRLQRHRRLNERWPTVILAMTHARFVAQEAAVSESIEFLDEFNETMNDLWQQRGSFEEDNWVRSSFGSFEQRNKHMTIFHDPFISLAAKFGLVEYVQRKLETVQYREGAPLLTYATEYLIDRQKSVYPLSNPQLVAAILAHPQAGGSPNLVYKTMSAREETPWSLVLQAIRQGHRRSWIHSGTADDIGIKRWAKIVRLFLDHGADLELSISASNKDKEMTAVELFTTVTDTYGSATLIGLKEALSSRIGASADRP